MTAEVAPALAELLLKHPELLALNLNDTSLTDEGVSAIAQSLHACAGSLQVSRLHSMSSCFGSACRHFACKGRMYRVAALQSAHGPQRNLSAVIRRCGRYLICQLTMQPGRKRILLSCDMEHVSKCRLGSGMF